MTERQFTPASEEELNCEFALRRADTCEETITILVRSALIWIAGIGSAAWLGARVLS
ncbi:hypothetical protein LX81_00253 [Palleronia aestuarii]|uniref:Uncharacterized protein n=1 Tax=Palleronia aestuarii TaxID=568105 RepID=A0A2W7NH93_9RHOB|nr:hypothetical protein [Palleronia aestuarii]PZX19791.1 hypothetical protein LX81_00253 [Palleronia aestuarii]